MDPPVTASTASDLRRGVFRRSVSDEDLSRIITSGIAAAGMPGFSSSLLELTAVLAFIRAGFDPGGTAVTELPETRARRGVFAERASRRCHRVNGEGPRSAPNLVTSARFALRQRCSARCWIRPARCCQSIARCAPSPTARRFAVAGSAPMPARPLIDDRERLVPLFNQGRPAPYRNREDVADAIGVDVVVR